MKHQSFIIAQGFYHSYLSQSTTPMTSPILDGSYDLQNFLWDLQSRGMSPQGVDAMEGYIRSCWDKGVDVVLDPGLDGAYGTYDLDSNTLTLGGAALDCNVQMIETMEHEFIHVLQDEMAGIWNSDAETLGLPVTSYAEVNVANGYSHLDLETQALELEAFSGEQMLDAGGYESLFAQFPFIVMPEVI